MAKTTRQTSIFGVEDWKRIYQTYREADFQSYDFETLRKSFIDYIRLYYPESFNDYIESSEFIALLDVMAFMGQAGSFRNDLNTRENFIDTAERRDSVNRLAELVSYTPKRNTAASGFLKVQSISTTEGVIDFTGVNLSNVTVNWNDTTNANWLEQFTVIVNAALDNSQRFGRPGNSQTILGVQTDEYALNLIQGFLPVIPFTSTVNGTSMGFEAVCATTQDETFVYEPSPAPNGAFNILYRNDKQGYASANTGYFFLFKQGSLQDLDFNLGERISNRVVNVNIEGINNEDTWLYQLDSQGNITNEWDYVENIYSGAVEELTPEQRRYFTISSRTNDQINLNFGDGVFSSIPVGSFRTYVRASNGLSYIINQDEMQNVTISIGYVSRTGRNETLTFTCALTQPVSNAANRENINDIKQRAPARYYTQNRMVNGEDYNNFPYTLYSTIIKSKAVNRSSIGTSRYLDLVDITGKYSSTNVFASDGLIYENTAVPSFTFTFVDQNDITDVIVNQVEPVLASRGMQEFYYENFTRPDLAVLNLDWSQSTTSNNETTGFFRFVASGAPAPVGPQASDNKKYIAQGGLVKFTPPAGQYFTATNRLAVGSPTLPGDKTVLWATVTALELDGTNQGVGNNADGTGPVTLNNFIPTNAVPTEVIPNFITDLPTAIETTMRENIELYRNFGLGYDNLTSTWYVITSTNINNAITFSLTYAQNTSGTGLDNSWLVDFTTDGVTYTVSSRSLQRFWASVLETRFFYDGTQKVYDPKTGTVINDFINVLKTNNKPDSSTTLNSDEVLDIIDQPVETDGFVDDFRVRISYKDSDNDGIPDNPDYFTDLVAPTVNPNNKRIYLQQTVDFDNLERYLPLASGVVIGTIATKDAIELVKSEYADKQVFYAYTDKKFYQLTVDYEGLRTITEVTGYDTYVGRQGLYFQYRHNAPLSRRIDPGTTNIIDLYLVTQSYYIAYQNYIRDSTGTVTEPAKPTIDELTTSYSTLDQYKMISDNIILNSITFKPLFGTKASVELQATIKCVKNTASTASVSEIKSQVVSAMNTYFTIENWDFGDTFFFSELSAYLHDRLGSIISSVVLVPTDPLKSFGDLYEIRSQANEIFVNAATVNDVQVIDALTGSQLRTAPNSGVV
ncbi:hypothetical protein OAP74_01095 [bacterium]|nr:hypothetical protein [bacterium]